MKRINNIISHVKIINEKLDYIMTILWNIYKMASQNILINYRIILDADAVFVATDFEFQLSMRMMMIVQE